MTEMLIRVRWLGPDRMLPAMGEARAGEELTLPDWAAKSYVEQGLAEYVDLVEGPQPAISGRRSKLKEG